MNKKSKKEFHFKFLLLLIIAFLFAGILATPYALVGETIPRRMVPLLISFGMIIGMLYTFMANMIFEIKK